MMGEVFAISGLGCFSLGVLEVGHYLFGWLAGCVRGGCISVRCVWMK